MSAVTINQFNAFKNNIIEQINEMENKLSSSSIQDNNNNTKTKTKNEKKTKLDKKTKASTDPDEPPKKRGTTGYRLFSEHSRPETKQSLIDSGQGANPKIVLTELGNRWKLLNPEEKDEWNAKAKTLNSSSEEEHDDE